MKTLIFVFLLIAIFHFVYEGIIAPALIMTLRNRLFVLRDELRSIRAKGLPAEDERAFWFVHDGLENFLDRLPYLTIGRSRKIRKECESDAALVARLEEHLHAVQHAKSPEIGSIFARANAILAKAFAVNSGGWMIYVVPLAVLIALGKPCMKFCKRLLVAPTKDLQHLMPSAALLRRHTL